MDTAPKGMIPMRNMIPAHITVRHSHQAWYIVACSVDSGNGITRLAPPERSFISEKAAVNFAKRMVLHQLQRQGRPELDTERECHRSPARLGTWGNT